MVAPVRIIEDSSAALTESLQDNHLDAQSLAKQLNRVKCKNVKTSMFYKI